MDSNEYGHDPRPVNERGPVKVNPLAYGLIGLALALVLVGLGLAVKADAAQPYGGCKEGWQAPQSEGADWCRAHGWLVMAELVAGPRGYVRAVNVPPCKTEDSAYCYWDGRRMGNGRGMTYVNLGSTEDPVRLYVRGFK